MAETASEFSKVRVETQLARILANPSFGRSAAMSSLLRHLVGKALAHETENLKEYSLGIDVFRRGPDFDPRIDPIVRVQARNLRARLDDYYRHAGAGDPILVELPKGSYIPVFRANAPAPATLPEAAPAIRSRVSWRPWLVALMVGIAAMAVGASMGFRAGEQAGANHALTTAPLTIAPFEPSTLTPETAVLARLFTREALRDFGSERTIALLPTPTSKSFQLGGVVACYGERVVVKAQLFRGPHRIWSGTYERLADTPETVVRAVLAELQQRLKSVVADHWRSD